MQTAVTKWGNSLAVRLPRNLASDAGLSHGTPIDLRIQGESLVITRTRKRYKLQDLLEQMKPEHRHKETDWGEPVGEEVW